MKKRIVVVCPGRGSYTKDTLGYLKNGPNIDSFLKDLDDRRKAIGDPDITGLDASSTFKSSVHTKGEHASPLIYACAYSDFQSIDQEQYEIVAICGNSMGWYLTLAFSESLDWEGSFNLIQTMGGMMRSELIGVQFIYPIVDEDWKLNSDRLKHIQDSLIDGVYISIKLGGYLVLAGEKEACKTMMARLEKVGDYPFQLINHGAFHTPLLQFVSDAGFEALPQSLFKTPKVPIIDGRGHIWRPHSTSTEDLRDYTLRHQVLETYDFSKSIEVALKEFAPDQIMLLGPGNSLGGVIGQCLIENTWKGITDKDSFQAQQKSNHPMLKSMGLI